MAASEPKISGEHFEPAGPLTDSMQAAIREELNRVLASSRFQSSHRCQILLRYVVENALTDKAEGLKERTIGIDLFGRDVAYDTSNDSVVRMAAGEVRKKLAQYYYDPANNSGLRIELPAGSYMPVFTQLAPIPPIEDGKCVSAPVEVVETDLEVAHKAPTPSPKIASWSRSSIRWLVAGLVTTVAAGLLFYHFRPTPQDAFQRFWAPVVSSRKPLSLCVGHRILSESEYHSDVAQRLSALPGKSAINLEEKNKPVLALHDMLTLLDIAGLLKDNQKGFSVRGQAFTSFEDLQHGPVLLLGAFNNDWTLRLTKSMRFHFERDPNSLARWIADAQKPAARIGEVQIEADGHTTEDYAIIARIFNPQTKEPTIILAGVTAAATHAAGTFITNPSYLNDFLKKAPYGWQTKNMELLIVADNVNGDSGPPRVVESYFW